MDHFRYRDETLHAEDVPLPLVAERFGTPCYVYCRATLERHWRAFDDALRGRPHLVCFAAKANSNLGVLSILARLGSGFDIVSVGELDRVLAAGGEASKVIFSGVGKREDEIRRALEVGIRCFNLESEPELERIDRIAGELGTIAPISVRVNPDVDAGTHPYISTGLRETKFGIDIRAADEIYRLAAELPNVRVTGIGCHIGSQLTNLAPFVHALERVLELAERLERFGIPIEHLDLGGGLGIRYTDETPPEPGDYARVLERHLEGRHYEVILEPGRAIAGNAGILLTRVEYLKRGEEHDFAILDAAMNDLIRPALYQAQQEILPVLRKETGRRARYDLVGPVCETADFLGKARDLTLEPGDLLAVRGSGAYGFAMSSNYNSRPRAAEVIADGSTMHLVRRRETLADLFSGESVVP